MSDPQAQLAALLQAMQSDEAGQSQQDNAAAESSTPSEKTPPTSADDSQRISETKILEEKSIDTKNVTNQDTGSEQEKQWQEFTSALTACPLLAGVEAESLSTETTWEELGIDTLGRHVAARTVMIAMKRNIPDSAVAQSQTLGQLQQALAQ